MSVQEVTDEFTFSDVSVVQQWQAANAELDASADCWQLGQSAIWLARRARLGMAITAAAFGIGAGVGLHEASPADVKTGVISTDSPLGPPSVINLQISPKLNQTSTNIKVGLGEVLIPKHLNVLGEDVGVNVQADLSGLNVVNTKGNFNSEKFQKYEDYLVAFKPELARIVAKVKDHYESKAIDGGVAALEVEALLLALGMSVEHYLKNRPQTEANAVKDFLEHFGKYLGLVAIATACAAPITSDVNHTHPQPGIIANAVFNGTPLQGAGLKSPLTSTIVDGVKEYENLLNGFQELDQTTLRNVTQIFQAEYGQNTLPKADGAWRLMVVDDFQGRYSMIRTDGHIAKISNVDKVAGLGDWSLSGSSLESPATDWFGAAFGRPGDIWAGISEHDSSGIRSLLQQAGDKVSNNNKTQQLGKAKEDKVDITDYPERAPLGGDSGHETTPGAVQNLINNSIAEVLRTHPFVFMNHDVNVSRAIARLGIVPLVLGGRSYQPQPTEVYTGPDGSTSVLSISGSGGGLKATSGPSFKLPDSDCYLKFIDYYPQYKLFTEQAMIIHTDGSVTLGDETPMNPAAYTSDVARQLTLRAGNSPKPVPLLKPTDTRLAGKAAKSIRLH